MNTVYFGNHAYGIEAAAQTYFSKHAKSLNLPEAALLAGLPQAPSIYDPFVDPGGAIARRDEVLQAMLSTGTSRGAVQLGDRRNALDLSPGKLYTTIREPYFFGYVRDQLIEQYGANTVRSGGSRSTRRSTRAISGSRQSRSGARSTEPTTRRPRSSRSTRRTERSGRWLPSPRDGRASSSTSSRRRVARRARRSRSSSSRPPSRGRRPVLHVVRVRAVALPARPQRPRWDVTTYDGSYSGWSSIRSATLRSDNTIYAQLTVDLGPANVAAMAKRMGVQTPLLPVPSLGLGVDRYLAARPRFRLRDSGGPAVSTREPMAIRKVVLPGGARRHGGGLGHPAAKARALRGRRVRRHEDPRGERPVRHRHRRRASGGRRREDRHDGRPRRRVVRRATRPTSRPWSGSAIRRARSRWRACTASQCPAAASPREIWHLFMEQALVVLSAARRGRSRRELPPGSRGSAAPTCSLVRSVRAAGRASTTETTDTTTETAPAEPPPPPATADHPPATRGHD